MKFRFSCIIMLVFFLVNLYLNGETTHKYNNKLKEAKVLISEGDLDKAFDILTRFIKENISKSNNNVDIAEAYFLKAKIFYIADDTDSMSKMLDKCFSLFSEFSFSGNEDPEFEKIVLNKKKFYAALKKNEEKEKTEYMSQGDFAKSKKQFGKKSRKKVKFHTYPVIYFGMNIPSKNGYSSSEDSNFQYGLGYSLDLNSRISIELDVFLSNFSSEEVYLLNWKQISIPLTLRYKILTMKNRSYYYLLSGFYLGIPTSIEEYYQGDLYDISDLKNENTFGYTLGFGYGFEKIGVELKFNRSLSGIIQADQNSDFKFNTVELNIYLKLTDKNLF